MRIASFIVPLFDNDGAALTAELDSIRADLLEAFGGFTEAPCKGAWRDEETGAVYRDESTEFRIGADWDSNPRLAKRFANLVGRFAKETRQLAIFATAPDGESYLISPGATQPPKECPPKAVADQAISWRTLALAD